MTLMRQMIGNAVAEWEDATPLAWTMAEEIGPKDRRETKLLVFDLYGLLDGYEASFVMALKEVIINRRKQISLNSVHIEHKGIRVLLAKMHAVPWTEKKVAVIDHAFLTALRDFGDISPTYLLYFRRIFLADRTSSIFAPGLVESDFPKKIEKKGQLGKQIETILAKALSRAVCVHILGAVEKAWERNEIDISLFAFAQIAFLVFLRPESYIRITLDDLVTVFDEKTDETNYYLMLMYPKARTHVAPNHVPFKLNRRIGELLCLQRIHVINTYGHLVDKESRGRLALFPNRKLNTDGQWEARTAKMYYGRLSPSNLREQYRKPICKLAEVSFDFNSLRHTVGTQLAQAGLSQKEIQAVLKHASNVTCQAYVDIHFHGMMEPLSQAMESAFIEHFPVFDRFRTTSDTVTSNKAIVSRSEDGSRTDLSGECGAIIACQYAPISCYACHRFIPCYDADHSINLDKVEAEIRRYESAGKPFQKMLEMSKEARIYILLVIAASEHYRENLGIKWKR